MNVFTHTDHDGDSLRIETPVVAVPSSVRLFAVTPEGGAWLSQGAVDRLARVLERYRSKPVEDEPLADWEVALLGAAESDLPTPVGFEPGDRVIVRDVIPGTIDRVWTTLVDVHTDDGGRSSGLYGIESVESLDEREIEFPLEVIRSGTHGFQVGARVRVLEKERFYGSQVLVTSSASTRTEADWRFGETAYVRADEVATAADAYAPGTVTAPGLKVGDRVLVDARSWVEPSMALRWSGPGVVTEVFGWTGPSVRLDHSGEEGGFDSHEVAPIGHEGLQPGDRVLFAPRMGTYSARPGATAVVTDTEGEFGTVRIVWDRESGLAMTQRDGGYEPSDLRRFA